MPKPEFIKFNETTILKYALDKGMEVEKEVTLSPWQNLCNHMGLDDDWMDKQQANSIIVVDKNGNLLKNAAEIEEITKTDEVFIFSLLNTDEPYGPFAFKQDENGNYLASERQYEMDELFEDDKIPEQSNFYTILYDPDTKEILNTEKLIDSSNINELNIDEFSKETDKKSIRARIKLSDEDASLLFNMGDISPITPYSSEFRGHMLTFEEYAPELPPEDIMPAKPRPLTSGQKFWNSIVSIFNKKGSAAKQNYDRMMNERTQAETEYALWKADYDNNNKEYITKAAFNTNIKNKQAEAKANLDKFLSTNPEGYDLESELNEKATDMEKMRTALLENPLAGITHILKNGINIDNIECYEELLSNQINGKPLTKENQKIFAEYLIVHGLNNGINKDISRSKNGGLTSKNIKGQTIQGEIKDFREYNDKLANMANSSKKDIQIDKVISSDTFEHFEEVFKDNIDLTRVDREIKNIKEEETVEKFMVRIDDLKDTFIKRLGEKPVGSETVETLVKLCLLEKEKEGLKLMLKNSYFDDSSKSTHVSSIIENLNQDYFSIIKTFNEMKASNPKLDEHKNESFFGEDLIKPENQEQIKYNKLNDEVQKYYGMLEKHPGIKEVLDRFEGEKFSGHALYSAFQGFDRRLIADAKEAKKLAEKETVEVQNEII